MKWQLLIMKINSFRPFWKPFASWNKELNPKMSLNFQIHFSLVDSQFDVIKMAQTSNVLLEWSSYAILELRSLLLYWDTIIMLFGVFSLFYINSSRLYMRLNCRQNECIIKYQPENGISDGDDNNNMLTNYNNSNIPFYNKI